MDEKISLEAIALYGDAYSDKVIKSFFASKTKITGPEILSLCSIHQINLFVIRELFKAWKEETRKQKSAYFDYDHPDVIDALNTFMSVLSNHIAIDQSRFAPLLKKAVSQTLMIIFDPYDFYSMLVAGKNNKLEVGPFREEIKYLKINKAPLERMLIRLEDKRVKEIPGNEAFAILDQILEEVNFTPEDLDDYSSKFSAVHPLDPGKFYVAKAQEPSKSLDKDKTIIREKVVNESNISEPTVNERLNNARQQVVIDSFRKISRIKDNLTINQKFMFTKVLFYGDFESFSRAIDDVDQCTDLTSALAYLEKQTQSWDRDSKEFHEFMEMVEKRFS